MTSDAKIDEVKEKLHEMEDNAADEDTAFLDIYIRFNDDQEKDYCFQITTTTRFNDLYKIFETLPIALRPSLFYHPQPIGFRKSTSPGYLTEDGNFLFDEEAGKTKSSVIPGDELINSHVWPGQLILPEWQFNDFAFYSTVALLLTWLYTDLPDFISPTPGICLTNQITKLLSVAAIKFGYSNVAKLLLQDIEDDVSIVLQCIFFAFHLIKVGFLFGFLYTGAFNPIRLFRMPGSVAPKPTKEQLVELGWTGTRKATIEEYRDYYREFKIQEHGGMIQAHQAGLFNILRHLGVQLQAGEGYNTPLVKNNMKKTMKEIVNEAETNASNFKLQLSYEWFAELGYVFAANSDGKEGKELAELIKQFRRYGLLISDRRIKQVVQARKSQVKDESNNSNGEEEKPLTPLPPREKIEVVEE